MYFITNICWSAEYAFFFSFSFWVLFSVANVNATCDRWSHLLIYINSYPIRYWIERVCFYMYSYMCMLCSLLFLLSGFSSSSSNQKNFCSIYIFIESLMSFLALKSPFLFSALQILFWFPLEHTEDKINSIYWW